MGNQIDRRCMYLSGLQLNAAEIILINIDYTREIKTIVKDRHGMNGKR